MNVTEFGITISHSKLLSINALSNILFNSEFSLNINFVKLLFLKAHHQIVVILDGIVMVQMKLLLKKTAVHNSVKLSGSSRVQVKLLLANA
jgi:hypothetical protein